MASDTFHSHIRTALSDPNLQAALDKNADRRHHARQQAYTSLPEPWYVMRQRAHEVRAEVISNLDRYLEQFVALAQSNGMIVHSAADAHEATSTVLNIAKQNQAKLVAKSKTMVSEEIGLNQALESEGLRVVETDLGEYIVQLRGERPSHIITPAVHLRRSEVGQTFHEKLGIPITEDIPTLTSAARRTLRQVFLEADIGVSGVNFGVADTGTLCIITNEGNGRLVTTLPSIHIALMGIERLLPTLDDLALMLYLLPRSATGQKITVYTNLIHGPSKANGVATQNRFDDDGPNERHLVLVDNGRSAMRHSSLADALFCIRCGACLNACPVFREIGGHAYVNDRGENSTYPGPIGSIISPGLMGQSEYGHFARASSLCGACKEVCPVDIDLPKLLLRVRAGQTPRQIRGSERNSDSPNVSQFLSWGLKLFTWIATGPRRFTSTQKLVSTIAVISPAWWRLPAFTGWGYSKDFPRPPRQSFRERWKVKQTAMEVPRITGNQGNRGIDHEVNKQPFYQAVDQVDDTSRAVNEQSVTTESLMKRFEEELTALEGRLICCASLDLPEHVLNLLQEKEIRSILSWNEAHLAPGLLKELQASGIKVHTTINSLNLQNGKITESMIPRAGLTGAIAAVAETGTLVLPGGNGYTLSASMLPEVHIAIFHIQDLYLNLAQVFNLRQVREAPTSTLISGPSRTADIEMTLTIGVHGPSELHVFCVDDSTKKR